MLAKKLSVIVPVYYNADSLPELFEQLKTLEHQLSLRSTGMELIFVDDGSGDHSFEMLLSIRKQRPETKLIKLTRNFGGLSSSWSAFPYVTGDCVAVLAADLQDPPEQIFLMFEAWEQGHKLVFSYRRSRKDPLISKILSASFYKLLATLVIQNFPKGGTDMLLMDKSLLPHVLGLNRGVNYSIYLVWLGFEAKLLPYDRQLRRHGKSRWSFKNKFFYFLDTLLGFNSTPLRIISSTGLIVSFLSLAYGTKIAVSAMINGVEVPGFITLAVLISFSTSIIVTMLSIIGEYLWRIFEIVSQHPKSVVEKTYLELD